MYRARHVPRPPYRPRVRFVGVKSWQLEQSMPAAEWIDELMVAHYEPTGLVCFDLEIVAGNGEGIRFQGFDLPAGKVRVAPLPAFRRRRTDRRAPTPS